MTVSHRVYGLHLQSERAVPGLEPCAPAGSVDIHVRFLDQGDLPRASGEVGVPWHISGERDFQGRPTLVIRRSPDQGLYQFSYADGTDFLLDEAGSTIWARWPDPLTLEDAATYLLGPVLGFVLRLRGRVCLHASSVAIGDFAVGFVGPSGSGKSTLAAAMAAEGFGVLGEDVLPLRSERGSVWVDPGYPLIRLWEPSVQALFGAVEARPLLTPNWDKRYSPLSTGNGSFVEGSLPLRLLYLLDRRSSAFGVTSIQTVRGRGAIIQLVANTYGNNLLDSAMRAEEFVQLSGLLSNVEIRHFRFGDDLTALPSVVKSILADVDRTSGSSLQAH